MKTGFLKEFLKERKMVGSVRPSSKVLVKKMLKNIDFESTETIIEFGPGTGIFTRYICKEMKPGTKLYLFELNQAFYEDLKKEFGGNKNIKIINDSAANAQRYMNEDSIKFVDIIVSSLPLTNFNQVLTARILKTSDKLLKPNGKFIQYQYTLNARKILSKIFNLKAIKFTAINIPPAFIYVCQKK